MLAPGTQEAVTLVDFSERYENIFSAIELTKLSVEYGSLTMDAGQRYTQEATLLYDSPILGTFAQDVSFVLDYSEETGTFVLDWTAGHDL